MLSGVAVKDAETGPRAKSGHGPFQVDYLEATTGFEPVMGVLQTPALPLGYVAPDTWRALRAGVCRSHQIARRVASVDLS